MIDFTPQIQTRKASWIARRRDLHQYPELAFEETRTAGIVAAELERLGLTPRTGVGGTGVIALLDGATDGPTVLVRADMDALPIQEENDVDYASQSPGKMHACGHDGHTTIALAVAELLAEHRDRIAGRVKFVFQPAEEIGQGAEAMIKDGALDDPAPDIVLGLHLWNDMSVGHVALVDGPLMAAANDFEIRLCGKGGHGALPHETRDPIYAASQIVTALQSIVSRNIAPTDTVVVSVTEFKAGSSFNVIPPEASMRGTIRAFSNEARDLAEQRLRAIVDGIATALDCTADVTVQQLTYPVINAPEVNARLRSIFRQVAPDITLVDDLRMMVSEDVSYFMNAAPGSFFMVGSANPARELNYPHHHPRFDWDDEVVIPLGANLLASAVAAYVLPDYVLQG